MEKTAVKDTGKDKCKGFLKFLEETVQVPEEIALLQEFLGYCMIQKNIFQKCLVLISPGASGVSVFLRIVKEIIGPENCASVSFNGKADQIMGAALYQKMLNISHSVDSKSFESPYFKAIVSGDLMDARIQYKNAFTFRPHCKLIFVTQKMPRMIDGYDHTYNRRILKVKFKRQFLENDPDIDPFLEHKLMSEKFDIMIWAFKGLIRLLENKGFTVCEGLEE